MEATMSPRRPAAQAVLAVLVLALGLPSVARGDDWPGPGGGISGISQYVEDVPTASGRKATTARTQAARSLPRQTQRRIVREGGDLAPTLIQVATSARYGAPQTPLAPAGGNGNGAGAPGGADSPPPQDGETGRAEAGGEQPSALSAGVSAASSGDAALGRLAGLLIVLTIGAILLAAVRSRRAS
jgi:hypothetical protein